MVVLAPFFTPDLIGDRARCIVFDSLATLNDLRVLTLSLDHRACFQG